MDSPWRIKKSSFDKKKPTKCNFNKTKDGKGRQQQKLALTFLYFEEIKFLMKIDPQKPQLKVGRSKD